MSRWISQFKNHQFHQYLASLQSSLDDLKGQPNATPDDRLEIARLKKAFKYVNDLLNHIDPELTPINYWDGLSNALANVASYVNQYVASPNSSISNIHSANNHIDAALSLITPLTSKGGNAAKTARYAFEKYAEEVEEHLLQFHDKSTKIMSVLQNAAATVKADAEGVESLKAEIEEFRDELFVGNEDKDSFQKRLTQLERKADDIFDEVSGYHDQIFLSDNRGHSISSQIESALKEANQSSETINDLLEESQAELKELNDFYQLVFGTPSEDDKTVLVGGLKNELNKRRAELDKFKKEQEDRYKALNDEIENLLPGATSAGLTTAYSDMKKSFNDTITVNTKIFYGSIAFLFLISLVSITNRVYFWGVDWVDISQLSNLWSNLAYKIPLAIPVIWLAFFASKRRSEAQRLQQEYAHKEALAKSFQSYKTQVEQLGQASNELMMHLLKSAIDAIAFNASVTLETKHGDKSPLQDVLDKLIEKQEKIEQMIKADKK